MRQWTTDAVDPAHRLDYWTGAICEAFLEMDCSSRDSTSFAGQLNSVSVGSVAFNQVIASTQDVFRTSGAIARGQQHPFYLITHLQTAWHVRQSGSMAQLRPGDAVLVDSAQRYELHFPNAVACLSLQLPRAWLGTWLNEVDTHKPRVIARDQGWGKSLSALNMQLGEDLTLAQAYPQALLSDQIGAMLAAALEPSVQPSPVASHSLVQRAEQLMLAQLDHSGLTADWLSQELGVSARTLHRSFAAQQQTFAATLRRHRLMQARGLLAQTRLAGLTVAEVGRRCGYVDASHFVREFQRAWGMTPARWRKTQLQHGPH